MKLKIVVGCLMLGLFAACGGNAPQSAHELALEKNPEYQKGMNLVAQNNCLTCHQVSGSSTGPAYDDVANKYLPTEANIDMLAQKVISGGSGHWGSVPMTPHPTLSMADAQAMVKYILMLRTAK